jgi:hypothetical protein
MQNYHRVQDYLLHLIIVFCWCGNIFIEKREKKQDSKSYLDSKSIIFEVINSFRLYDRVCIVSALTNNKILGYLFVYNDRGG